PFRLSGNVAEDVTPLLIDAKVSGSAQKAFAFQVGQQPLSKDGGTAPGAAYGFTHADDASGEIAAGKRNVTRACSAPGAKHATNPSPALEHRDHLLWTPKHRPSAQCHYGGRPQQCSPALHLRVPSAQYRDACLP